MLRTIQYKPGTISISKSNTKKISKTIRVLLEGHESERKEHPPVKDSMIYTSRIIMTARHTSNML